LQTKYFLTCNILPPIEGNDDAIWRRFIVLPFKSHFVMNPDPKNPYEFKRDNSLAEKMKNWREAFILVLIKYYKLFIDEGGYGKPVLDSNGDFIRDETGAILLKTPFEIETAINEYKNESNVYAQFAQDRLEKEEGSLLKLSEAYDAFTNWHMLNAIGGKPVSRPAFKKELERACSKNCYVIKGVNSGWHGWKVKKENDDQNPDFSKSEL
jgi:phage/plasmid-associated DNA primase